MRAPGKVYLEGRGEIELRTSNYLTSGGEAAIYKAAKTIIKIYTDTQKMQADQMPDKIARLAQIKHPGIVAPKAVVRNKKRQAIGYYMSYAKGLMLPEIISNQGRQRHGADDAMALDIVEQMRQIYIAAHKEGAVIVDGNELNWVVKIAKKKAQIMAIDVDAWAIDQWQAKVIMPSIIDHHTVGQTQESDWFAWAVVSFQILTGIHPYKGSVAGYKRGDLQARMKDAVSVFAPGVKLNRAVRDFDCIPNHLKEWYQRVFQDNERTAPPEVFAKGFAVQNRKTHRQQIQSSAALIHTQITNETHGTIMRTLSCGLLQRDDGMLLENAHLTELTKASMDVQAIEVEDGFVIAELDDTQLQLRHIENIYPKRVTNLDVAIEADQILVANNRLFVMQQGKLREITIVFFAKAVASIAAEWDVMANATKCFEEVAMMDAMGAAYAVLPFGDRAVAKVRLPELDAAVIVDAKAGPRFLGVTVLEKGGEYRKYEYVFNAEYSQYTVWEGLSDEAQNNIAILPKGVCATIVEDGKLAIVVPSQAKVNTIADAQISTQMQLRYFGNKVAYLLDGSLYEVRMK